MNLGHHRRRFRSNELDPRSAATSCKRATSSSSRSISSSASHAPSARRCSRPISAARSASGRVSPLRSSLAPATPIAATTRWANGSTRSASPRKVHPLQERDPHVRDLVGNPGIVVSELHEPGVDHTVATTEEFALYVSSEGADGDVRVVVDLLRQVRLTRELVDT